MEVVANVALASFTDLCNAKLSCTDFCKLSKDDYIFQHLSLKELRIIWCRDDVLYGVKTQRKSSITLTNLSIRDISCKSLISLFISLTSIRDSR